jgi:autotransporter-associated beta strand protein
MSGIIAGGSSGTSNVFSKSGAGTLAFTAQNSYWGDTIVGAGTLMIGDGSTVGGVSQNTPNIIVEAGATLAANRSNTLTQGTNPFKVAITGDGGFTQAGSGNTVLVLANTYIGPTTLDAGTLTLGAAGVLPDASEVSIGNATLATGSFSETAGRLVITGTATVQLGTGTVLAFADSSAVDWTGGTLNLSGNFVSGSSLRFGTNGSGLTPSQLALITIHGNPAHLALDGMGYLMSGYPVWKTTHAPTGTAADDFDNDGVPNAIEYILGGAANTRDLAKLPTATTTGGNFVLTFIRDQASIDAATTLVIEVGDGLATWPVSLTVPATAVSNNPGLTVARNIPAAGKDTITLTLPLDPVGRNFARLKVIP